MSLPVIRIQKKTVYQRRLYSKNRKGPLIGPTGFSSIYNTTEIVILLQTTTLATTYIRAPDNPPAAASGFFFNKKKTAASAAAIKIFGRESGIFPRDTSSPQAFLKHKKQYQFAV